MNFAGRKPKIVEALVPLFVSPNDQDNRELLREKAYLEIKDIEKYPDYMESVSSIEVLKRDEKSITARWNGSIDGAPLTWIQKNELLDDKQEVHFEALEGDFEIFKGKWSIGSHKKNLLLQLEIEYRLGIPVIEDVLGPILSEKIKTNSIAMLEAIASRLNCNG
ncbi:MAG: SRPBCC family protein [Desulfosarcina sp.]|nr:SRPBCC family protein [Desulfobacterales bacterium]